MPLSDLAGNERIKKILSGYIQTDMVPYSLLFTGPDSAQIPAFALGFCKALFCLEMTGDFCDRCANCEAIGKGIFLDLRIMIPDGQYYKKEQIVSLIEDSYRKPMQGDRKVYLLKNADQFNDSSANSFLKILEEPSRAVIFILLARNLSLMLPTIQSRCQILPFLPLSRAEILRSMRQAGVENESSDMLASYCQCSMRNPLEINFSEFQDRRRQVADMLGKLLSRKGLEDILLDLSHRGRSRGDFLVFFRELINMISLFLRDIMIVKIDRSNDHLINTDLRDQILELSGLLPLEKVFFLIQKMETMLRDIRRNLNVRVLILEFIRSYAREGVYDV